MDEFGSILREPSNQYLAAAKDRGAKLCGYYCTYVPEELVLAAGMVPVRIRGVGSDDSSTGDSWLSSRLCTYSRWSVSAALDGHYGFLDGIAGINSCDQIRRASQVWMSESPPGFTHFIAVPRASREINYQAYLDELHSFKNRLQEWSGKDITDESLHKAISLTNRKRELLKRISSLRKPGAQGHVTGSEMLAVSVAATQMPPEDFLETGGRFLAEREEQPSPEPGRARLIVCGGELDDPSYLSVIESVGADIVGEFVCFGARAYEDMADEEGDPMEAIARRYFYHVPCVRMGEKFNDRFDRLVETVREFDAHGLVFQRLKFCQLWGAEFHSLLEKCREKGIPLLSLEREYGVISTGQVKTRVQAFLEKIEASRP